MPSVQAALLELGLHFLERRLAEVADFEQFVVGDRMTRSRTVVMPSDSRQLVARTDSSSSARLMFSLRSRS